MSRPIVISGLGAVGPWGATREDLLRALATGVAPLTELTAHGPFLAETASVSADASALALDPAVRWSGLLDPARLAPWVPPREGRRMSRPSRFAVAAARIALEDAGFSVPTGGLDQLGVVLSTAFGPAAVTEELLSQILGGGPETASPFLFAESVANAPAAQVARLTGARGANLTIAQREAGTLIAVRRAAAEIVAGRSRFMFAGVADEMVPLLQALFDRFGTLARGDGDTPPVARPFDRHRDGFLTAEGAALVLLEEADGPDARGTSPHARILGGGEAFDPTAPRCGWGSGHQGLGRALARVLDRLGLAPGDVDLVVSGATGARDGDRMEALTLRTAWESAGATELPPIVAPRGTLGMLGGGLLATSVLLAEGGWDTLALAPSPGFSEADPELGVVPHGGGPLPDPASATARPGRAPGPPRILIQTVSSGGTAAWLVLQAPATRDARSSDAEAAP